MKNNNNQPPANINPDDEEQEKDSLGENPYLINGSPKKIAVDDQEELPELPKLDELI